MSILRFLLFPFALLYDGITRMRNHLYNIGHKPSVEFDRTVISVGNLNVGGSGKTPMVEYLVRLLQPQHTLAILSRGYGRKTRGLRFASNADSARTIGDEPYQYFRKFGDKTLVTVGEDRVLAIPEILHQQPETDVILLDDAFQHRAVKPQFSILLTEFSRPFYSDYVLPVGTLREARSGVKRADVVVVTKCPVDLTKEKKEEITQHIKGYAGDSSIFFSTIRYGAPQPIHGHTWASNEIVLVSGIAKSTLFEAYARTQFSVLRHFDFADHHSYTTDDIQSIVDFCNRQGKPLSILTTEKDMVKLLPFGDALVFPWFYLPIETVFIDNGAEFDGLIREAIQS